MSNFFSFEKDLEIISDENYDPSRQFKFKAFGGSPWFGFSGYATPQTQFDTGEIFTIPVGEYEISLNRNLKGTAPFGGDFVAIKNDDTSFYEIIGEEPKVIKIEKQMKISILFSFDTYTRYLFGDFYSAQEDYGKDYSIQINLISGGLYERSKSVRLLKGDANLDGFISYDDLILFHLKEVGVVPHSSINLQDINEDGVVDKKDRELLEQYLNGSVFFW